MSHNTKCVLDDHALEEPHIPVGAGHAPRLAESRNLGGLCLYERVNPRAYIVAEHPFDVRE